MAILPVSPLDIISVERVARAIQWWLNGQRYQSYPTQINMTLQVCPVCHSTGSFTPLDNQSFRCECSECGSSWGTRTCGSCGKKYPFIQLAGIESHMRQLSWIDRTLGRDVLAIPCWKENNQVTFICSFCGTCSQAQQVSVETCIRCRNSHSLS